MEPIRYIVVGSGWRSLFYHRIAKAYPERFRLTAMVCRTEEKAGKMREEYGIHAVTSDEEAIGTKPDFVVVAVNKASIFSVTEKWVKKGYPVLCETPAALNLEDLRELWRLKTEEGAKIQVAEQYFLYPSFDAGIRTVKAGYLGDPYAVDLSAVHDYHGASLIRRYLDIGFENVTISGKRYEFPVEETDSRYGAVTDGSVTLRNRDRLTLEFEKGKAAFYDFGGVQYHSMIRGRHVRVQGQRGELDDDILRYVDEAHKPHEKKIEAEYDKSRNLSQDETAIAELLVRMKAYISGGPEAYPLAEALQDAYVSILMAEALKTGKEVRSERQIWGQPV
jgi:predicted dehydrogenase